MERAWLISLFAAFWIGGCHAADTTPAAVSPYDPSSGAGPTPKQALQLLIRNHDVPLSVHPSCEGVGTEFSDQTIGDYISGFLAELSRPNSLVVATCDPLAETGREGEWRCEVVLGHADGAEKWRWGVRFDVDADSGRLVRESVRCTGMG